MKGLSFSLLACLTIWPIALSSAALSYCKCTCDKHSFIMTLNEPGMSSCQDCTRQLCTQQAPTECLEDTQNPAQSNIVTECFQRESAKDETIVILFLLVTVSLLIHAMLVKPYLNARRERLEAQYGQLPSHSNT